MAKWLAILMAIWQIASMTTHRRHTNQIPAGRVILFCDSDRNANYGGHVWTLKTDLPEVSDSIIEYAAEFFGVESDEAKALCNPEDIVATAGAWDYDQFCSEVSSFYSPAGFKTPDGAVVFDRDGVELAYNFDAE